MVDILQNIVPAMSSNSRVLIGDNVISENNIDGLAGVMDLLMMCIGGKERTRENFEHVLERAGLKVEAIHHPGGEGAYSGFSIVEAVLK